MDVDPPNYDEVDGVRLRANQIDLAVTEPNAPTRVQLFQMMSPIQRLQLLLMTFLTLVTLVTQMMGIIGQFSIVLDIENRCNGTITRKNLL